MVNRREFIKLSGAVVGGLVIGGVAGYAGSLYVRPSTASTTTVGGTGTVTQTVTQTIAQNATQNLGDLSTLVVGMNLAGGDQLDPAMTQDTDAVWIPMNNAYDTFLEWEYPDFSYVGPGLLSGVTQGSDGVTWTGTVTKGATFADGTPITSADLVYTVQRGIAIGGPGTAGLAQTYYGFIGLLDPSLITAPDPNTVQLKLPVAYSPNFVRAVLCDMCFNVINQKIAEAHTASTSATASSGNVVNGTTGTGDHGSAWLNQGNSAGSGPFVITEWVKEDHITMVANTNYWGQPKPRLKKVILQHVSTPDAELALLQKGSVDVMWDNVPTLVAANKFANGISTSQRLQAVTTWIIMNVRNAPLNNESVWNAIKWSIDYSSIVDSVLAGAGAVMETLSWQGLPFTDPSAPYSFNPTMAKQLLATAGYSNGFSVSLLYANDDPILSLIAPAVQSNLSQSGINVTLTGEPGSAFFSDVQQGKFQLAMRRAGGGLQDIANIAWNNLDPTLGLDAHWMGYNDSQAIALVDACKTASASAAASANLAMTEYALRHSPTVPIVQNAFQVMFSTGVVGLTVPFSRLNTQFSWLYKQAVSGYT